MDLSTTDPGRSAPARPDPTPARLRRRLVITALLATVLGVLHHTDHVVRGNVVAGSGLPHEWNHSGWPFYNGFNQFTASLAVYLILLGGIALTLRRRAWAGYWLAATLVLVAIVVLVHFLGPQAETPRVIWTTYGGGLSGVLALADLFLLLAVLAALALLAVDTRRKSGRWRDQKTRS